MLCYQLLTRDWRKTVKNRRSPVLVSTVVDKERGGTHVWVYVSRKNREPGTETSVFHIWTVVFDPTASGPSRWQVLKATFPTVRSAAVYIERRIPVLVREFGLVSVEQRTVANPHPAYEPPVMYRGPRSRSGGTK